MRIVSQDGTLNMSYEKVIISRDGNRIYAFDYTNDESMFLGEYESADVAQEVMKKITVKGFTLGEGNNYYHMPKKKEKKKCDKHQF